MVWELTYSAEQRDSAIVSATGAVAQHTVDRRPGQRCGPRISDEEANASTGHEVDDDEIEKFIEGVTHRDAGSENVKGAATPTAAGRPLHGVDEAAVREHPSAQ